MKCFAVTNLAGGQPAIDFETVPITGYVFCGQVATYACYLFSGTQAQLALLATKPGVNVICQVSDPYDPSMWADRTGPFPEAVRVALNTWLSAHGSAVVVPAGRTWPQVLALVGGVAGLGGFVQGRWAELDANASAGIVNRVNLFMAGLGRADRVTTGNTYRDVIGLVFGLNNALFDFVKYDVKDSVGD